MKLTAIWKKLSFTILILAATLSLTACSYQKPERYTVKSLGVDSITTVCGTDCSLSDVVVATAGSNCSAAYTYTKVENDVGIRDAKTYHDYLAGEPSCLKIDDFSEDAGAYTAYVGDRNAVESDDTRDENNVKKVALGVSIKVSFAPDSYTVTITDNINLDEVLNQ